MIGDVTARIIRSDGNEFIIGDGEWRITKDGLENWANLPYTVNAMELPMTDGAIVTSKRVSSVDRTITAECRGRTPDEARAEAIKFFNPKYTYEVHMTYRGRTRWCEGEQIGFKASEGNMYERPSITWTILCPNPYLRSESNFGKDLADSTAMMGFPWFSAYPTMEDGNRNLLTNEYAVASVREYKFSTDIVNAGDVETGLKIVIKAKGYIDQPYVKVGDNLVTVNIWMNKGTVLELDMSRRPPTVTANGENIIHYVDRNSSIFSLLLGIGSSRFEYGARSGRELMSVTLYWNEQYLGL